MFSMTEVRGNLFEAPSGFAFAHCVSADKALGAGIALEFRRQFPEMLRKFDDVGFEIGKCYGYTCLHPRRSVINIVTKNRYFHKPTYSDFSRAIENLRDVVLQHRIRHLAIPRLGCGLDRLDWSRVQSIIYKVFKDTDVEIIVYSN